MKILLMRIVVLFFVMCGGHALANPTVSESVLLAQAAPSKQVVMYATSWCPYCQQARNYFREQGIPYVEHDIEKDAEAKRAYQAFGGKGIPVIFVGQQRMNGFSVASFNKIYR
jgi:glutaredoxin